MPRVIAGTAGGRPLKAPPGRSTRPTSDRVKEALFSSLGDLVGLAVLDLYAGSGGLGVEALSRGAASAVLVEQDRRTAAVIRANLSVAGVDDRAHVVTGTVAAFCAHPIGGPFDVVVVDPPYATPVEEVAIALRDLAAGGGLVPGARMVLERDRRADEPPPEGLRHDRDRRYGDTVLRHLTWTGPTDPDPTDPDPTDPDPTDPDRTDP